MNNTLHWLYKVPGRKKYYVMALTALQALTGFTGVLFALLLRNIVDSAVGHDEELLRYNIALIICLSLFQILVSAVIRWLKELAKADLENLFKKRLTDQILKKDYAYVSTTHTAEWLNRLTNDTAVVAGSYVDILPGMTGMLVRLVSAVVMIIVLDPWFAGILIPGGILLILLTFSFRRILKRLHKQIQESDGRLRIYLQERISSLMVIKSFAAEEQTLAEAEMKMAGHKAARMKRNRFSNICNIGFGAAMQGMYLAGIIYCSYGIFSGRVSYGTLMAIMQLVGQVQAPFANISGYLPRFYAMTASAERLMEAEEYPDDNITGIRTKEEVRDYYENTFREFGLEKIHFTYYSSADNPEALSKENMPKVLEDISLQFHKGEYTAFTGDSGCGKSTVMKLLMCMYHPDSGRRYIDDKELTAEWRRLFAYVPQGNILMNGTIRDVVAFGETGTADGERIRKALRIACAESFVDELEQGMDTMLGERGTGLSEGQMQRIAVARAVYADAPVLLLDECTSALDSQTEMQLLKNLRSLTDKTVIIITHRPAALEICDRVLRFSAEGIKETAEHGSSASAQPVFPGIKSGNQ